MSRLAEIGAKHSKDLRDAHEKLGDHEEINAAKILKWFSQFTNKDLPLAVSILKKINYYDTASIRAKAKQLVNLVKEEFPRQKIVFVPIEANGPGGGSGTIARVLKGLKEVRASQVKTMLDFAKLDSSECDVVVFFDDFSGSGKTLSEWWPVVEPIIRPKNIIVAFGLLAITSKARSKIQGFADQVLAVDDLSEDQNVLGEANTDFSSAEKAKIIKYCKKTKCESQFRLGFDESGLLLAFKHGCPNNSLPILWWHNPDLWEPLFRRRAI